MRVLLGLGIFGCLVLFTAAGRPGVAEGQELLSRSLIIHVLDAGDGEAVWLTTPDAAADLRVNVLIDCGPSRFGSDIVGLLQGVGVQRIDWLLISTAGEERIGGCPDVIRQMRVQNIATTGQWPDTPAVARLNVAIQSWSANQTQPRLYQLWDGQQLQWGKSVRATVLNPRPPGDRAPDQYDDSLAMEITYGNWGVLLAGDVHEAGRQHVLESVDAYLATHPVQVLKVADHGSVPGTSPGFLSTAFGSSSARYALLTNGSFDWSTRPDSNVVRWLGEAGAQIVSTAQHGTITVIVDPDSGPATVTEH